MTPRRSSTRQPVDTSSFKIHSLSPTSIVLSRSQKKARNLNVLQGAIIVDVVCHIATRTGVIIFFSYLLMIQNKGIFDLIIKAQNEGKLGELNIVLGVLTAATLAETYFVIREIIKWLMRDIPYKRLTQILQK